MKLFLPMPTSDRPRLMATQSLLPPALQPNKPNQLRLPALQRAKRKVACGLVSLLALWCCLLLDTLLCIIGIIKVNWWNSYRDLVDPIVTAVLAATQAVGVVPTWSIRLIRRETTRRFIGIEAGPEVSVVILLLASDLLRCKRSLHCPKTSLNQPSRGRPRCLD